MSPQARSRHRKLRQLEVLPAVLVPSLLVAIIYGALPLGPPDGALHQKLMWILCTNPSIYVVFFALIVTIFFAVLDEVIWRESGSWLYCCEVVGNGRKSSLKYRNLYPIFLCRLVCSLLNLGPPRAKHQVLRARADSHVHSPGACDGNHLHLCRNVSTHGHHSVCCLPRIYSSVPQVRKGI